MRLSDLKGIGHAVLGDLGFLALVGLLIFALIMLVTTPSGKRFPLEPFEAHHEWGIDPLG